MVGGHVPPTHFRLLDASLAPGAIKPSLPRDGAHLHRRHRWVVVVLRRDDRADPIRGHRTHHCGRGCTQAPRHLTAEAAIALALTWHPRCGDIPESLWRAAFGPPHEGRFWFDALEAGTLPGQFTFRYGCLARDGDAIGIVPAFRFDVPLDLVLPPPLARLLLPIAKGPLRGLAYQRTFFIGNVAGEEGHVGLVSGVTLAEVARFIHGEARAMANSLGAPMLVWKDFPEEDRVALDALAKRGRIFRILSYPGTSIALVPGGHAAFLATMRSDRRHKIRSKLRKGKAAVAVLASVETRPGKAALDEIFSLFEQTRRRATTSFETVTPGFFWRIATSDVATFVILREAATERMLAFMLVLDLGERAINQFIGLDYRVAEAGYLYFQLFEAAYDWAARTSARVFLSGQTGYMAKLDLGHILLPLWNYCEHRSPVVNAVFRRGAADISWGTLDPQLAEYLRAHPAVRPGA